MPRISFNARLIVGAAAAACVALGGTASAQAQDGDWYMGLTMPLMFIDDTDSTSTGSFSQGPGMVEYTATVTTEHDTGFKFGGMIGRHLGSGLRVEGEVFMARADVSRLTNSGITVPARNFTLPDPLPIPVSGSADQLGAMVNLWYDFDAGGTWTPYIGGGLGFVRVDQGGLRYDTGAVAKEVAYAMAAQRGIPREQVPPQFIPAAPPLSTTDTAFAYQIGGGIGYALSDSTTLQIGYRLQMVNGLSYGGSNDMLTVSSNTDLRVHFLEIGIRYRF